MTSKIDFDKITLEDLEESVWDRKDLPKHKFEVMPPSARDIDAVDFEEVNLPNGVEFMSMQDPCPYCGAFKMSVGDYVFLGTCMTCYEDEEKAYQAGG